MQSCSQGFFPEEPVPTATPAVEASPPIIQRIHREVEREEGESRSVVMRKDSRREPKQRQNRYCAGDGGSIPITSAGLGAGYQVLESHSFKETVRDFS